ncbi:hypothetical protein NLU13_4992 [Sarocladium strictum]|uniref:C2H2-type domain-containing protein n=1 Tax=Sarocladium strictum TaxID=5046 RepID=A0AA39GLP3_SARSR|nr:hypothetical protein NLU13_4992 [Sarocladium strictum]
MPAPRTRNRQSRSSLECPVCHKTYSKAEHLQRHERTHTGAKPFACQTCGRRFNRLDSLGRHQRTHARVHSQSQPQPSEASWHSASATTDYESMQYAPLGFGHSPYQSAAMDTSVVTIDHRFSDAAASDGFGMTLEWPDSEALLQSIISSDWNSLALPPGSTGIAPPPLMPPPPQPVSENSVAATDSMRSHHQDDPQQLSPNNGSREAVQSLSDMVSSLSKNVTSAVESMPELTTVFMDNCLQAYFAHFNTQFPILHRPTFVFRDCSPSLILNAIALGSLYIGTPGAVAKGEALWRLAHTAVATSWPDLIRHQGPYDTHRGVQLLLTALLGQSYAMMSKNENLRLTSQVFHSLGFNWANQCNMFTLSTLDNPVESPGREDLSHSWKVWAAREVHRRGLLGYYILDGHLTYLSGQSQCIVHANSPLALSASPVVFEAQSAEEWYAALAEEPKGGSSFREVYASLFSLGENAPDPNDPLRHVRAPLDAGVILECLHVLVREQRASQKQGSIINVPPSAQRIRRALVRVHGMIIDTWPFSHIQRLQLMLRWHFVCMDSLCDSIELLDQICRHLQIQQRIFRSRESPLDLTRAMAWTRESPDAKGALLHAIAMQDIMSQLPLSCTQGFWMPVPTFAISVIYSLFRFNGTSSISIPANIDWTSTLLDRVADTRYGNEGESPECRRTRSFLAPDEGALTYARGPARNLPFDMKQLQSTLHSLAVQWGVSSEMEDIVMYFDKAGHTTK